MSKPNRDKRRLYDKLNSFEWRERWQTIIHLMPLWLGILALLVTVLIPWIVRRL